MSAAAVERGRVRGVLGGGGAGEGAGGARRRGGSGEGDSYREGGGSRSSVLMNIQYFFILNMKKYHQI